MIVDVQVRFRVARICACFLILYLPAHSVFAQPAPETSAVANPAEQASALAAAQLETLRQLQAQQAATLKVLEQSRLEIAATLATLASNNLVHLTAMTETLTEQRTQDMKALRDSYRIVLAILVGLTGLLLLSILFLNVTSIRAVNRLATVLGDSALVPSSALPQPSTRQLLLFPGEKGQPPLSAALMQLQRRIQALEHVAGKPPAANAPPATGAVATQTPPRSGPAAT